MLALSPSNVFSGRYELRDTRPRNFLTRSTVLHCLRRLGSFRGFGHLVLRCGDQGKNSVSIFPLAWSSSLTIWDSEELGEIFDVSLLIMSSHRKTNHYSVHRAHILSKHLLRNTKCWLLRKIKLRLCVFKTNTGVRFATISSLFCNISVYLSSSRCNIGTFGSCRTFETSDHRCPVFLFLPFPLDPRHQLMFKGLSQRGIMHQSTFHLQEHRIFYINNCLANVQATIMRAHWQLQ